jgi:hypothetical protein
VNLSRNSSKTQTRNTATLLNYRSIRKLNVLARVLAPIEGGYTCLHRIVGRIRIQPDQFRHPPDKCSIHGTGSTYIEIKRERGRRFRPPEQSQPDNWVQDGADIGGTNINPFQQPMDLLSMSRRSFEWIKHHCLTA